MFFFSFGSQVGGATGLFTTPKTTASSNFGFGGLKGFGKI